MIIYSGVTLNIKKEARPFLKRYLCTKIYTWQFVFVYISFLTWPGLFFFFP
ncbi:hypothetical protein BDA99DRAFT_527555, partial [Phascolomyces articulosus]